MSLIVMCWYSPRPRKPTSLRVQWKESEGHTHRRHPKVKHPGGWDDILKHEGLTGLILRYRLARNEGESRGAIDLLFDHR